ncbi:McrC family protein [Brumimicrobium oceani]|uniref:Restriction endonuclease n=1 Tax=Brumimicrobium oceani TaxID=2100725 RepID=A0A2U2XEQ1_9FLAO|nr:restriction endonuclease [Brumimicrobium oceani]PWH86279.1 restriction endonuclease [Brumimicrobium oceani]
MRKVINRFEHGRLFIGEEGFNQTHLDALIKLNTVHESAYFDIIPKGIKFKQFVGVLQVGELLLQIHPKADKDENDGEWKGVLLQMLKACGRIKAQSAGEAQVKKQHLNLLEVYFEYFLREIEYLIHRGLIKQYRRESGNVKALKGKLEFAQNIRHNHIHKERFYTTHQVYDTNHQLHQILAVALEIVGQFSRGSRLNDLWRRMTLSFPEVEHIKVTSKLLESVTFNRKSMPYKRAFELARLIILNYSPDINKGRENMIALLFDMNELWEDYVFIQLRKEVLKPNSKYKDYEVLPQRSKGFWKGNSLKPDIVIEHKTTKRKFVIDTKWKRPGFTASVDDLRQVYTYARFWNAENVMLLYPGDFRNNKEGIFKTTDSVPFSKDEISHKGYLRFVKVVEDGRLCADLGEKVLEGFVG